MSGINWDYVNVKGKERAAAFAKLHPTQTIEAAYFAGLMECAAERESLRVINERLQKETPKPIVAPADKTIGLSVSDLI